MSESFVEVLGCVSVFPVEEGQRFELDDCQTFRINRGSGDLALPHARVSRTHARLQFAKGGWWAIDESSTNGTLVNGRNANPAIRLSPGDIIDIAGVLLLRFEAPVIRHVGLEDRIAENPTEEGPWRIWHDWLLENNDPLGAWINSRERPMTERAAVLGPLARAFKGRDLTCTWNVFGFVTHLTMPFHTLGDLPNALWLLRHLDDVPAARFVTSLTLELLPIALVAHTAPATTLVEALNTSLLPRSLRTLHFAGKLPESDLTETRQARPNDGRGLRAMMIEPPPLRDAEKALAHVRTRALHLQTDARSLVTWDATTRS